MLALLAFWIASSPSRRLARAAFGLLAILVGHLCYLVLLDCSPAILSLVDRRLGPPPAGETPFGRLPAWSWSEVIHLAIPWNMPVAGALIHFCFAGLLITIGPSRDYSADERRAIRKFVENGGILVGTVGDEDPRKPALPALMAEYGLYLGEHPPDAQGRIPESPPLGHFKSPYYNAGSFMNYVRFHAAWPVVSTEPDARVMAYGPGDRNVMIMRRIGKGKVVLVGDTCFAENKNLEREGGEPFEGMRENADFWRWAITYWTGQPLRVPPNPRSAVGGSAPPLQGQRTSSSTFPATQRILTSPPGSGGEGGS